MSVRGFPVVFTVLVLCGAPLGLAGAEEDDAGTTDGESREFHANTLGVFVGGTFEGRGEALTLGIEYERRINESFGVGVIAEYVSADLDPWVFALPFAYHNGPWKLYAGPGVEDTKEGSEFMARIGVEYAFEVGDFEISPQVNLDFVDSEEGTEEVWVAGFLISKGF